MNKRENIALIRHTLYMAYKEERISFIEYNRKLSELQQLENEMEQEKTNRINVMNKVKRKMLEDLNLA